MLRTSGDDTQSAPAAGFERITDLIDNARAAGLELAATVSDPDPVMTAAVSTAAYRIVQEALTNAHRHGTGKVTLNVVAEKDGVTIDVANTRSRAPHAAAGARRDGYGLVGIRERAASVGGHVDIEDQGQTFRLRAHLPIKAEGHQ